MIKPATILPTLALAGGMVAPALATTCAEFRDMDADARNTAVGELAAPAGAPGAPDEAGALESRVASLLQLCEPVPDADIEGVLAEVGR